MKNNYIACFTLLIIWISLSAGGCERDRNGDPIELFIRNNSTDTIIASIQYNHPDSLLIDFQNTSIRDATTIAPNSESKFWAFIGWEAQIMSQNAHKTLTMIIYSPDTLAKYPFEKIQAEYNILKRYNLTTDSLKKLNWKVDYP